MDESEVLLSFKGKITSDFITSILQNIEDKLEDSLLSLQTKKNIFIVSVEVLQNILHHTSEYNQSSKALKPIPTTVFKLKKTKLGYIIITGNLIKNIHISNLKKRWEKINRLDENNLAKYYNNILCNSIGGNNGAGLGLIEITKRAEQKPVCNFLLINNLYSFYRLKVKIAS